MLASLSIQNVVLIDRLNIDFRDGLCALTGETGAGKSILLDALGLALGARSESGLVRKGADAAQVTAEFHVGKNHYSAAILKNSDLEPDENLILRRSVSADGRSRAFINDQPVSIGLLKQIGETLVEIHGQFETQGLLNPATHGEILDEYAGIGVGLTGLWASWKAEAEKFEQLKTDAEKSRNEETYLRQAVEDLDALSPKTGEESELSALRARLMNREQALEALGTAYDALNGENDPVRKASSALARVAGKMAGAADQIIIALDRASAEMQEAGALIQSLSADLQEGGHDLESIDDRLHELKAQARKHNCAVDDLATMRETLAAKLNLIEHADEALEEQMRKVEKARKAYAAQAEKDSAQRALAAAKLDKLVAKELPPLKLDKAKFVTKIETLAEKDWGPDGIDRVRFLVATNPGAEPGALNKIASGGEMARFMLALKVVMAEVGAAETLIFDEADAGIGGAVADAVGERLARLAGKRQVLVVTHAPQVAARAGHHYIVAKAGTKDVKTSVLQIDQKRRREEIARMLSGANVTDEARRAADKLLETGT
ncbi:MAG: DNA repair protein RecN [Alphaproteobacteria bacterium PRO2]|nr:DNA repair protein RecN [Alphaproteobacteria bacterium PRO2]